MVQGHSRWADVGVVDDEAAVVGERDTAGGGGCMRERCGDAGRGGTHATMGSLEMPWYTVWTAAATYLCGTG